MKNVRLSLNIAVLVGLVVSGCRLISPPPQGDQIPESALTAAAQTVVSYLTQGTPTATLQLLALPPTFTPTPTSVPASIQTPGAEETQVAGGTQEPQDTLQPGLTSPALTSPKILFQDDFSTDTGWFKAKTDQYSFEYARREYRITVNIPFAPIWSVREQDYADVRLEVDAARVEGPGNGYFGLVCRFEDRNNYYALVVSSDNTYGIGKVEGGELEFTREGTAQFGAINPGSTNNRVRADCIGETLSLYANDQLLLQLQDDDLASGWIGVIAGTRSEPGLVVRFDNFVAMGP